MKEMRKSLVHLAVAGGLIALSSASGVASAADVQRCNGSGTGQALIYPYYTVNNNWTTTFDVINTSDKALAVKVRFHEAKNSRDVLDFVVVMSPYDEWTAWVQQSETGGTQLYTNDKSCTSPLNVNGAEASPIAYTGEFFDGGGVGKGRLREGYVEVLVMGVAEKTSGDFLNPDFDEGTVPYNALHVDGVPRDCAAVDNAFVATADQWIPLTDPLEYFGTTDDSLGGSGDPEARDDFMAPPVGFNPLKGNVAWLHGLTGVGAGSEAIAVCDWSDQNYVTAQQFPWFLEPTFASGDGLWTVTGVEAFDEAVSSTSTFNGWANNPANGAATDWVITFPTKGYHVDRFNGQIQAAVSRYRNGNSAISDTEPAPGLAPFENLFNGGNSTVTTTGNSVITVEYTFFDREEGNVVREADGTTISPAPPPEILIETLKYEANVLQFGGEPVLDSPLASVVDAGADLNAKNGWAKVRFVKALKTGLPVTAFSIKERTRGEVNTAYGQAMNNGYERAILDTME